MLGYRAIAHPQNTGAFQAASILVPAVFTFLVLWGAAAWFPSRGQEQERAARFVIGLGEPSADSEGTVSNPAPIAGLVIGVMGLALLIVYALPLAVGENRSLLTLGMGIIFFVIGAVMVSTRWLGSSKRKTSSPSPLEANQ